MHESTGRDACCDPLGDRPQTGRPRGTPASSDGVRCVPAPPGWRAPAGVCVHRCAGCWPPRPTRRGRTGGRRTALVSWPDAAPEPVRHQGCRRDASSRTTPRLRSRRHGTGEPWRRPCSGGPRRGATGRPSSPTWPRGGRRTPGRRSWCGSTVVIGTASSSGTSKVGGERCGWCHTSRTPLRSRIGHDRTVRPAGGADPPPVAMHRPPPSKANPWNGQRIASPSTLPPPRCAPRCGQVDDVDPSEPSAPRQTTSSSPANRRVSTPRRGSSCEKPTANQPHGVARSPMAMSAASRTDTMPSATATEYSETFVPSPGAPSARRTRFRRTSPTMRMRFVPSDETKASHGEAEPDDEHE